MKKIAALIASLTTCAILNAAPSIFYVDMAKAYSQYYKAKAAAEQIQASIDTTKAEIAKMDKNRQALIKDIQAVQEKLKNPALTEDAKKKLAEEAQPKIAEIQQIEANMRNISQQANERLQQNANNIRKVHMQEIAEIVKKLASDKKADFILEKNACHFADPKADLTDELVKRINASAPAGK
jgi:outer membrane protein